MSLLSTKGIYGLHAMYQLFIAKSDKPMQIKEISSKADIPQNYLEQLLATLRKSGLVESIRGAGGGYRLSKEPDGIMCSDILEALEGTICQVENPLKNEAMNLFWSESSAKIREVFEITLKELCAYDEKTAQNFVYYI